MLPLKSTHTRNPQSWHAWRGACVPFHRIVCLSVHGLSLYKVSSPSALMCLLHASTFQSSDVHPTNSIKHLPHAMPSAGHGNRNPRQRPCSQTQCRQVGRQSKRSEQLK